MNRAVLIRGWALLFPPVVEAAAPEDRSAYERLAIPHTFKPRLSFLESVVAALATFLRLISGCILFAVWGAYSLYAWSSFHHPLLRIGLQLPLFLCFLLSFALAMLTITALLKVVLPKS
jgi:hypothetical protein